MLQKDEIKYSFDTRVLEVGDILLMNTYHEGQRRCMEGCIYDHAAIYAGDAFLLEADGLGVTQSHIYSYGFKEANHACVLRLRKSSPRALQNVITSCREQLGKGYSVNEAMRTLRLKDTEEIAENNKTFCSRYVASAYKSQGYDIVKNAYYCAPDDFLKSNLLMRVEDAVQIVSEELLPAILKNQSIRENPNIVLQEAFARFKMLYGGSIESMDELLLASIQHPELDEEAIKILENETKLFRPEEETANAWPWFDNDETFFANFPTLEDCLFFILNQFLHYDKTYLPLFARNAITLSVLTHYYPNALFLARVQLGFSVVFEEAKRVRKRLEYLYLESIVRDSKAFDDFVTRYGFYYNYEYSEPITDISFILEAALKYGFPPPGRE